ncbi:DUF58 domain-containing protein [Ottowia thiooxydans]|uniref:DUF58 domain-containing protein n=1 Tax=Ottowia thiooxydans TaxID=219182 RepID=UPI00041B8EB5|nr:DUF58 domain-containing protein [Ottowia thiooxydans]
MKSSRELQADPGGSLPWWHVRPRVRQWWLSRLSLTDTFTLTQRNVYILPTRAGWMLAVTLIVLLVASINYQLNLGYLLTFLLMGCAVVSMVVCHNTLRGLTLHLLPPQPLFLGGLSVLDIKLINARRTPRYALGMAVQGTKHWAWADVPAQGESAVQISFRPERRGLHRVPVLTSETRFPLGTFRVWTIWRPAAQVMVYPAPEAMPPPLPQGDPISGAGAMASARSAGEFDGVRAYQRGDPMKLVVWKKFAKAGELVSRDSSQTQRYELWLDFARAGSLDTEGRLSRLAAWVMAADAQGLQYGLRLPGGEIKPDGGSAQRLRCLRALALA